jgi:hypothetical protein
MFADVCAACTAGLLHGLALACEQLAALLTQQQQQQQKRWWWWSRSTAAVSRQGSADEDSYGIGVYCQQVHWHRVLALLPKCWRTDCT